MNGKGAKGRQGKEAEEEKKKKKCSKKTVRPENLTQCYGLDVFMSTLRAFTVFFLWMIIMTVIFGMSF